MPVARPAHGSCYQRFRDLLDPPLEEPLDEDRAEDPPVVRAGDECLPDEEPPRFTVLLREFEERVDLSLPFELEPDLPEDRLLDTPLEEPSSLFPDDLGRTVVFSRLESLGDLSFVDVPSLLFKFSRPLLSLFSPGARSRTVPRV
ncbi:MAG: hypothetical protein KAX38_02550, partial [Candidatus Krumholzibacteria bacterium]|nr:hypothetical protein [Candidatus Krumholzibacteria bacterium]